MTLPQRYNTMTAHQLPTIVGWRTVRIFVCVLLAAVAVAECSLMAEDGDESAERFFENEVRPLLSRACFECHGPKKQESGLRLDARAALLRGGQSGMPSIVPGRPSESLLVQAVEYSGDLQMPPDGQLTAKEIAVLRRWVEMGSPWGAGETEQLRIRSGEITDAERSFWSLQPIESPAVPSVRSVSWPRTTVDRFVLRRLEEAGVKPVAAADKRTLIRRATFDLTGLPPTPSEVEAFLRDSSAEAFETVVERLLASKAYGERWGRHWLDVVRYADTAGETSDYPLPQAFRYRNYVIHAFNIDKPYDDFIREQVAGDLLAAEIEHDVGRSEEYAARRTATGFLALSKRFGYDSEKYHYLTLQDTIDTLGQAVLGLSLGCARCHDHKFDPVSMRDYYGLYGIFASSRYSFAGSEEKKNRRSYLPLVPPAAAFNRRQAFESRVAFLENELRSLGIAKLRPFVLGSLDDADGDFELQGEARGGSYGVLVDPWRSLGRPQIELGSQSPFTNVYRYGRMGLKMPAGDGGADDEHAVWQRLRMAPDVQRSSELVMNLDLRLTHEDGDAPGGFRIMLGSHASGAAALELFVGGVDGEHGRLVARAGDDPRDAGGADGADPIRVDVDRWYNLQLKLDFKARRADVMASVLEEGIVAGQRRSFEVDWEGAIDTIRVDAAAAVAGARPALELDNFALRRRELAPASEKTVFVAPAAPSVGVGDDRAATESETEKKRQEKLIRQHKDELYALIERGPYGQAYGIAEGFPHDAAIQMRGEPDRRGRVVGRRWLEILGGDAIRSPAETSGRADLAIWLTRPENPLTARVMVNRIWQHHFGDGLVATESDFGQRGAPPTHPQLLDHLASEFMRVGWSIKAMHRLIMNSQTYQLASTQVEANVAKDPDVRLLWRFRSRRLDAESIRDSMLGLSGRLDRSTAGPHPFPMMAKKFYSQHGPFRGDYETQRRSVYLMTQRTKRHPFLSLFDGADPGAPTPKRTTTIVPTQSLFLLNDPFVHESAAGFATRVFEAESDSGRRVQLAYAMALGRPASADEIESVQRFLASYRGQLVAFSPDSRDHDRDAFAAFTRTLFCRNEFLFVE